MSLLEVKNLTVEFQTASGPFRAVDGVSLKVDAVDGAQRSLGGREFDAEVFDFEQGHGISASAWGRAHRAGRHRAG